MIVFFGCLLSELCNTAKNPNQKISGLFSESAVTLQSILISLSFIVFFFPYKERKLIECLLEKISMGGFGKTFFSRAIYNLYILLNSIKLNKTKPTKIAFMSDMKNVQN